MKIQSVSSSGAGIVLKLIGRFVFAGRTSFKESIKDARAANARSITLNFEQVSYIDSAGLGLLMLAHKELSRAGILLTLSRPQEGVLNILNLARIPAIIPIQ